MNEFKPVLVKWMNLEPITQSAVKSEREKQISLMMHIYEI